MKANLTKTHGYLEFPKTLIYIHFRPHSPYFVRKIKLCKDMEKTHSKKTHSKKRKKNKSQLKKIGFEIYKKRIELTQKGQQKTAKYTYR